MPESGSVIDSVLPALGLHANANNASPARAQKSSGPSGGGGGGMDETEVRKLINGHVQRLQQYLT